MRRYPNRGTIRPKVSTMPRQQSEAAAMLDLYKLVVEKKRLQQELQNLETRRQQIGDRLNLLDQKIDSTETTIQQMRLAEPSHSPILPSTSGQSFEMFDLEY